MLITLLISDVPDHIAAMNISVTPNHSYSVEKGSTISLLSYFNVVAAIPSGQCNGSGSEIDLEISSGEL
jgi:hypothetical protein